MKKLIILALMIVLLVSVVLADTETIIIIQGDTETYGVLAFDNEFGLVGLSEVETQAPLGGGGGGFPDENASELVIKGECNVNLLPPELETIQPRIWIESGLREFYVTEQAGNIIRVHNRGEEAYNASISIEDVVAATSPLSDRLSLNVYVLNIPPNGTAQIVLKPSGIRNVRGKGEVVFRSDRCYDISVSFSVEITIWTIFVNGVNDAIDYIAGSVGAEPNPTAFAVVPLGELENPFVKIWNYLKQLWENIF